MTLDELKKESLEYRTNHRRGAQDVRDAVLTYFTNLHGIKKIKRYRGAAAAARIKQIAGSYESRQNPYASGAVRMRTELTVDLANGAGRYSASEIIQLVNEVSSNFFAFLDKADREVTHE